MCVNILSFTNYEQLCSKESWKCNNLKSLNKSYVIYLNDSIEFEVFYEQVASLHL